MVVKTSVGRSEQLQALCMHVFEPGHCCHSQYLQYWQNHRQQALENPKKISYIKNYRRFQIQIQIQIQSLEYFAIYEHVA